MRHKTFGGIAESIKIADKFIGNDDFALMLGDNFYSENLTKILSAVKKLEGLLFYYYVKNASEYRIIEFDKKKVKSIKENQRIQIQTLLKLAYIFTKMLPKK